MASNMKDLPRDYGNSLVSHDIRSIIQEAVPIVRRGLTPEHGYEGLVHRLDLSRRQLCLVHLGVRVPVPPKIN